MLLPSPKTRQVVPQWRSLDAASASNELRSASPDENAVLVVASPDLTKRIVRFRFHPDLISASELVDAAIIEGCYGEATKAAEFIKESLNAVPLVRRQSEKVLRGIKPSKPPALPTLENSEPGSYWREQTRLNSSDALAWVGLSRSQLCAGHSKGAERSMRIALNLAPSNRYTLRAASRLYFTMQDYEKAYDVIAKNPRTEIDPWLMAAEIALSQFVQNSPRNLKRGLRFLDAGTVLPRHTSELASAMGSRILHDEGNGRKGRKLIRESLNMATTNSIAQAEWLSQNVGEINVEQGIGVGTRDAWEARAMHAYYVEANLGDALGLFELWMADEPYNVNAYQAAASVANVLERYSLAEKISLSGLRLGHSSQLLNSLAFSLISEGRYAEAEKGTLESFGR